MDSIGFCNIRGLNIPQMHGAIKWFLNHYSHGLFALLETRVKTVNFCKVFPRVCQNQSKVTNYQFHGGGRIWLVWLPIALVINICHYGAQFMYCEVLHKATGKSFWVTFVYGSNDVKEWKNNLLKELVQISP